METSPLQSEFPFQRLSEGRQSRLAPPALKLVKTQDLP
jgi:hypothetical protein